MDGSEAHRQRQWRPPQLVNYKAGHNPLLCSPSLNKARQKYNLFLKYLWFSYVIKKDARACCVQHPRHAGSKIVLDSKFAAEKPTVK